MNIFHLQICSILGDFILKEITYISVHLRKKRERDTIDKLDIIIRADNNENDICLVYSFYYFMNFIETLLDIHILIVHFFFLFFLLFFFFYFSDKDINLACSKTRKREIKLQAQFYQQRRRQRRRKQIKLCRAFFGRDANDNSRLQYSAGEHVTCRTL